MIIQLTQSSSHHVTCILMVVSSIQYTIMWLCPWLECLSKVLKGTSGWLEWLHGLQETSTYPMVTQNNFWHLWRATQENLARTWTLGHGFRVIYIKNASKSVSGKQNHSLQLGNAEQTKPRKELTSSMAKSSMCSVGTNLVQGVNLCNLILDCLKTIGLYRGRHSPSTPLQLGPRQNTHMPKSTKRRRRRRRCD